MTDIVREKLKLLPENPGVYIMKDAAGKIIYVGKAVVLKNRVRQYFQSSRNHTPKVRAMVAKVADFEFIMTASEVEALILECNLIKKHRPRYNISLKDDKSYPYVKVTLQDDFPRVFLTHHIRKDGARCEIARRSKTGHASNTISSAAWHHVPERFQKRSMAR